MNDPQSGAELTTSGGEKAVKEYRACGERNGMRKCGYGMIMFGRLLEEYCLFLYLRAELSRNPKVRSQEYKFVSDIFCLIAHFFVFLHQTSPYSDYPDLTIFI